MTASSRAGLALVRCALAACALAACALAASALAACVPPLDRPLGDLSTTADQPPPRPDGPPPWVVDQPPGHVEVAADRGSDASHPAYRHADVNHLLLTGQALAFGLLGVPPLSTTQPYANTMFVTGLQAGGGGLTSLIPLVEVGQESPASGLANLVTRMAREELFKSRPAPQNTHDLLVSCSALAGGAYLDLRKGTAAYGMGLEQLKAGRALAQAKSQSYLLRAVAVMHGETDSLINNASYATQLAQWQLDVQADVQAITGQSEPVPMLHSQVSSWTTGALGAMSTSLIPYLQLQAARNAPGRVVMVGPRYMVPYGPDGSRLTNHGYRQLGEYYGKVYRKVVLEGQPWQPLQPESVTLSGAEVRVAFHVPVPPLVLDATTVSDPGHFGFEFWDNSGSTPAITAVALDGATAVKITLAKAPGGTTRRIRYAYTGKPGASAGPATGPRGCLRDSDATASRSGYALFNWAVHFDEGVP